MSLSKLCDSQLRNLVSVIIGICTHPGSPCDIVIRLIVIVTVTSWLSLVSLDQLLSHCECESASFRLYGWTLGCLVLEKNLATALLGSKADSGGPSMKMRMRWSVVASDRTHHQSKARLSGAKAKSVFNSKIGEISDQKFGYQPWRLPCWMIVSVSVLDSLWDGATMIGLNLSSNLL